MTKDFMLIGERTFSIKDQLDFADFSGDHNPIHIDIIEARKTMIGGCVVHGINGLLWALNCLYIQINFNLKSVKATFNNPIYIDTKVTCLLNLEKKIIKLVLPDNTISYLIRYEIYSGNTKKIQNYPLPSLGTLTLPKKIHIENLDLGHSYPSKFGGDLGIASKLYGQLSKNLGADTIYEVAILSNIVGMQIPGLHSLFLECEISLHNRQPSLNPCYRLTKVDQRFGLIHIKYTGCNLLSKMITLERPHYESKKCSVIEEALPLSINLKDQRILVIGGSRGLGAAFAKVSTMLGAEVTITYAQGQSDAKNVLDDIKSYSDIDIQAIPLNVTSALEIEAIDLDYDILCYFASPKISPTKGEFEQDLFDNFYVFYCKSFERIARRFSDCGGKKIYWPSTIFLEENNKDFSEYIAAKKVGENICKNLASETTLKVFFQRLDKISTDQTLSLISIPMLDAVSVAIDIAKLLDEGNQK